MVFVIVAQENEYVYHLYSFTPWGGLPSGSIVKNPPVIQETQVWSLGWEDPLEKEMATQPTPVFFLGKPHGQRSLAGYSPRGRKRVGHDLVTKQQQNLTR